MGAIFFAGLVFAGALMLSACSGPAECAAAQSLALGLDLGGSWTPERHYADADAICAGADDAL